MKSARERTCDGAWEGTWGRTWERTWDGTWEGTWEHTCKGAAVPQQAQQRLAVVQVPPVLQQRPRRRHLPSRRQRLRTARCLARHAEAGRCSSGKGPPPSSPGLNVAGHMLIAWKACSHVPQKRKACSHVLQKRKQHECRKVLRHHLLCNLGSRDVSRCRIQGPSMGTPRSQTLVPTSCCRQTWPTGALDWAGAGRSSMTAQVALHLLL